MTGWRGHNMNVYHPKTKRMPDGTIRTEAKRKVTQMSATIWCDIDDLDTNTFGQTGHPFSAKDPDKRHFAQTQTVQKYTGNSYGTSTYQDREEVTEELDMCGYHWRKSNPFLAKNKPEINGPTTAKQKTLEELEHEDEMYKAGLEAGKLLAGKVE